MNRILEEGNLRFEFSGFEPVERFDDKTINAYGMKAVDFVAESNTDVYFIEIKDFQHPNAPQGQRDADYKMLVSAVEEKKSVFCLEMGEKIKDSLLRKYSEGEAFYKNVVYLLVINLDQLGAFERGLLMAKISGHIPTGLNDERFSAFSKITFDLVNAKKLNQYGIICTAKNNKEAVSQGVTISRLDKTKK